MDYPRIALAALGGTVTYFAFGFVVFGALPFLRKEYAKFPAVYRTQESMQRVMPMGMVAMLVAIWVLSLMYAIGYRNGWGVAEGARFGCLIGVFAVCSFVLHNYVNLNIGLKLTIGQALAYFVEWTLVGIAIGAIYKPAL
jgi:hypothetical protein